MLCVELRDVNAEKEEAGFHQVCSGLAKTTPGKTKSRINQFLRLPAALSGTCFYTRSARNTVVNFHLVFPFVGIHTAKNVSRKFTLLFWPVVIFIEKHHFALSMYNIIIK